MSGPLLLPTWDELGSRPQVVALELRSFAAFLVETTTDVTRISQVTRRHVEDFRTFGPASIGRWGSAWNEDLERAVGGTMNAVMLEQQVESLRAAYQEHDIDRLMTLFSENAKLTAAPGTFRGKTEIRQFFDWDARLSPTTTVRDAGVGVLVIGQVAVWERTICLSYQGIPYEECAATVLEFDENGRICRYRSYYDKLAVLDQIASGLPGVYGWLMKKVIGYLVAQGSKGLDTPSAGART